MAGFRTALDTLGFITDHREVMAVLREVLAGMTAAVTHHAGEACALLNVEVPDVPERIPEIHFTQAQELLAARTGEDPRGEPDLAPAHERWLSRWALREHGGEFLFVTGYPMAKRPFYTRPEPGRPRYSNSFDLLFRGLELVTGGQRLHRHEDYLAALAARGESPEPYAGYLAAFRHGMPPHGGFALGLERWTTRLIGADNIRRAALFPLVPARPSPSDPVTASRARPARGHHGRAAPGSGRSGWPGRRGCRASRAVRPAAGVSNAAGRITARIERPPPYGRRRRSRRRP